jgi:hypothetical protein
LVLAEPMYAQYMLICSYVVSLLSKTYWRWVISALRTKWMYRYIEVKIFYPTGTRTPTPLVVQPVASRYTD